MPFLIDAKATCPDIRITPFELRCAKIPLESERAYMPPRPTKEGTSGYSETFDVDKDMSMNVIPVYNGALSGDNKARIRDCAPGPSAPTRMSAVSILARICKLRGVCRRIGRSAVNVNYFVIPMDGTRLK